MNEREIQARMKVLKVQGFDVNDQMMATRQNLVRLEQAYNETVQKIIKLQNELNAIQSRKKVVKKNKKAKKQ